MTTEELDFSKICRVCCLNGTLLSLFKVHLNRKLMACSNITVSYLSNVLGKLSSFRSFLDMEGRQITGIYLFKVRVKITHRIPV